MDIILYSEISVVKTYRELARSYGKETRITDEQTGKDRNLNIRELRTVIRDYERKYFWDPEEIEGEDEEYIDDDEENED